MNYTVKDLADYVNIEVREMIKQLNKLAPDVKWKPDTAVPDKLVDQFIKSSDEYKQSAPIGMLAPTEGGNASQSLATVNHEAAQYAIMEALEAVEMKEIITTAIDHSLDGIATYENTKAQVWGKYIETKLNNSNARTEAANQKRKTAETKRQVTSQQRMQQATDISAKTKQSLDEANDFLAKTLNSI